MTEPFYVKAGMSSSEYNQRNQPHPKKSTDRQPAGLNFHKYQWNKPNLGIAQLDHGEFSFTILNALGFTGTEDAEFPERGIDDFDVRSIITPNEFINHDQARTQFMAMLQNLVTLGWLPYLEYYSRPRLAGQQSLRYAIAEMGSYAPDPMYTPTLDEWMQLGSGQSWAFHADNVFMKVGFRRNGQHMEKQGDGVYLVTHTILTRDARARNYFQGDEREQWQDLWVKTMKPGKIMRYRKEVEMIKRGYHINTQYVEPKIHPEDPVEPDETDEVKALLDYIKQHNP